jgi:hypothetical protein
MSSSHAPSRRLRSSGRGSSRRLPTRPDVAGRDQLDRCEAVADAVPEATDRLSSEPPRAENPRLDEDVVAGQEALARGENALCICITVITTIGSGAERGGIDKERQRRALIVPAT